MDGEVYSPYLLVLTSVFVSYLMQRYMDSTLLCMAINFTRSNATYFKLGRFQYYIFVLNLFADYIKFDVLTKLQL